jgi:hypothetical protein
MLPEMVVEPLLFTKRVRLPPIVETLPEIVRSLAPASVAGPELADSRPMLFAREDGPVKFVETVNVPEEMLIVPVPKAL